MFQLKKKLESVIQNEICKYLLLKKWLPIRINSGSSTQERRFFRSYIIHGIAKNRKSKAFPDMIALKNDKVLLFEIKRQGTYLSKDQKYFKIFAKDGYNVEVNVVRSIVDVEEALNKLEKKNV